MTVPTVRHAPYWPLLVKPSQIHLFDQCILLHYLLQEIGKLAMVYNEYPEKVRVLFMDVDSELQRLISELCYHNHFKTTSVEACGLKINIDRVSKLMLGNA